MLEPPTLEQIRTKIEGDLVLFAEEVANVRREFLVHSLGTHLHGYPRTLFGYVMHAFAYVDFLSRLWEGRSWGKQNARMLRFMNRFFETPPEVNAVCLQMWRHGLMHTADPQQIRDQETGTLYTYLLHWGEPELPPEENLTLEASVGGHNEKKLNLGLEALLSHLKHANWAFFHEAQMDPGLSRDVVARWMDAEVEPVHLSRLLDAAERP